MKKGQQWGSAARLVGRKKERERISRDLGRERRGRSKDIEVDRGNYVFVLFDGRSLRMAHSLSSWKFIRIRRLKRHRQWRFAMMFTRL